jgi:hypothetical protein
VAAERRVRELRQLVALILAVALALLVIGPVSANGTWERMTTTNGAVGYGLKGPNR